MTSLTPSHKFTYQKLSSAVQPNLQPCIKICAYFNKLPSISHEEFYTHWATVHADLTVASEMFKETILRYVQVRLYKSKDINIFNLRQTPEMKEQVRSLGADVLPFDACAEFCVRSFDDWTKFASSESFRTILAEDSRKFVSSPLTIMVGQENLIVGESITALKGKDGLSNDDLV
ncbi:MAG: hypothetical protein M1812_000115 [Candelaria pacifica]|nr:MAG: hypothetical protein M1812_000115 [Candelaria pacifica]